MNNLTEQEVLELANSLGKKIALSLDQNDLDAANIAIDSLMELPNKPVRTAIKDHIGLDRIIIHNLDCNPKFEAKTKSIQDELDAEEAKVPPVNLQEWINSKAVSQATFEDTNEHTKDSNDPSPD